MENPLQVFEKLDPEFFKHFDNTRQFALAEGALPRKFKFLIAMALDAAQGTVDGTRSLAQAALKAGATKEELAETIRVAQYINGAGSVWTAARALKDLL